MTERPQGPDIDNMPRVAWGSSQGIEVWSSGATTHLIQSNTLGAVLSNRGDVGYNVKTTFTPWQVRVFRDGLSYHISSEQDIVDIVANSNNDINDAGEMVWAWHPDGRLSPMGIRMMRLIRNGDTDFDDDVDLDDFIPMPGCFTGPVITDGLCECRFFDIDHDRDVDLVDLDYLLRNYTGPLEDCNANSTLDLEELLTGAAADCNLNGRIDSCDLADNPLIDCDLNGRIDVCDVADNPTIDCNLNGRIDSCDLIDNPGLDADLNGFIDSCCSPATPPTAEMIAGQVSIKNRFLSFTTDAIGAQAIRVTFVNLPAPFDLLNGQSMWVGAPREVSQSGANVDPVPGFQNFWAATLTCVPHYADWSALGTINVYHETVIPLGAYAIQVINEACGAGSEINFSPALTITNARWGDTVLDLSQSPSLPPEGAVNIVDALAVLARFSSAPGAIVKARADLEPTTLDLKINIADVLASLAGFQGLNYPFTPTATAPCTSPRPNVLP